MKIEFLFLVHIRVKIEFFFYFHAFVILCVCLWEGRCRYTHTPHTHKYIQQSCMHKSHIHTCAHMYMNPHIRKSTCLYDIWDALQAYAAYSGSLSLVSVLLSYSKDPHRRNALGCLCVCYCVCIFESNAQRPLIDLTCAFVVTFVCDFFLISEWVQQMLQNNKATARSLFYFGKMRLAVLRAKVIFKEWKRRWMRKRPF